MGDRTLNDLYMLVGAVETSEGFLHSKEFADALLTQGRILRDCGHFELATILDTLAAEVLERPWRSAVSRRPDPTWGYAEQYPVWSLLMPSRAGDTGRPLDPIRALFLGQLWNAPGDIDVAHARRLAKAIRPALRTLENPHTPEIKAKVLELQGAALQILRGTADGEFALRIIGELQNQDVLQQTPASELRQLFPRAPRLSKSPGASSTEERPAPTRTLREPSRGVFVGETRRDPTSTLDESDPPDTTVTLVQPELSGRVAGEIAVTGTLRLMHLQLDEHSPDRLHASEVKEIVAYLAGAAEAALDQHQIVKAEASLAWLLVVLTTRALRHITRQRVGLQGDSEAILVSPDFTSWTTNVPHADAFWTPKDLDSSLHLSAKTDIAVQLPIPERIRKLLCRSRDKLAAGDRLFRSGPAEIEAECDRFYRELRTGVGPRFSEKRLRLAILIEMVASSGDPCLAQIIAGHRIDQSDAPLHYYSIPTSDIQRLYADAVTRNFGWEIAASTTLSESRTGAPITALDRNVYLQFSAVLRREISETFGRARTSATWQDRCNAVTRYTAWLVAAAMAHRVTHWLSELTVLDIHPDGWAVIRDKNVSGAPHLRVVALPPSAMRQIGILRQTLIRAAESLLVSPDASVASCAKALRDSADGCAPLFVWVRPDHTVGSLDVERLRKFWLRENGLPGNFLRSRTRMLLTEQDVAPQWIYWQLGHVYLGRAPFGPECLHSISEFSAALNPALEVALATDGWNPAPTMMARQAIPPWPNPPFLDHDYARAMLEEIEALKAAWNAQHGMPLDENFNYPEDLAAECSAWAERALATLGPQQPERLKGAQHHVDESALNEVVAALLNSTSDRNKIDLSLRMLRSRLKLLFKSKRWSGTLPPRLFRPKFSAPSITKGHVRAARLSSTIREAALNANADSAVSVRDASLARLAILLIFEGQARTANALREILNPQTLAHGNPSVLDGRRLLLDAAVADSRRRGFIFSPESTAAAERWLEVSNGDHPTLEVITRALRNYLPPALIRNSGKNLLQRIIDVCTLGLVALLPGAALFRVAAEDPLTISSERTGFLLRHQLHPLPILAAAADDESVAIRTSAGRLRGNVSVPAAIRQYRRLTRALYALSERGDRQRIDHRRYTKARMAAQQLIDDPGVSPNVALIAFHALELLSSKRGIRVRTVHDYITLIGAKLLHIAGSANISALDEDGLEEIYGEATSDRHCKSDNVRAKVAAQLMAFHATNAQRLADADLTAIRRIAAIDSATAGRVEILTSAEFSCVNRFIDELPARGTISALERRQLQIWMSMMYYFGARASEPLHLRICDVFVACDDLFVFFRNSPLGLRKSPYSRRCIAADRHLPADVAAQIRDLTAKDLPALDRNRPLLTLSSPNRAAQLLDLMRRLIHVASSGRANSLHALRHSRASTDLRALLTSAAAEGTPPSPLSITRLLGHSRLIVSLSHYWHFGHLAHAGRWNQEITSEAEATIRGISAAAVRKRRERNRPIELQPPPADDYESRRECLLAALAKQGQGTIENSAKLLMRIRCDEPIERVIAESAVGSAQLESLASTVWNLAVEQNIRILTDSQMFALAEHVGVDRIADFTKHLRRQPAVKLSRLRARRWDHSARDVFLRMSGEKLKELLRAAITPAGRRTARQEAIASSIPSAIARAQPTPFFVVALIARER